MTLMLTLRTADDAAVGWPVGAGFCAVKRGKWTAQVGFRTSCVAAPYRTVPCSAVLTVEALQTIPAGLCKAKCPLAHASL